MQLDLDFLGRIFARSRTRSAPRTRIDHRIAWKQKVEIDIVFRARARRYLLSLQPDGVARLVIPRRGTESEGMRFLERSEPWLMKRMAQWQTRSPERQPLVDGSRFLFRGEDVILQVDEIASGANLKFGDEVVCIKKALPDYRESVHAHLRKLAEKELPPRVRELAAIHGAIVKRVSVRAQKSRWGSCSARGTISLNWRLIQTPPFVADYIIIHELMHLREMNHSRRYWKLVEAAFPDYLLAEKWLKSGRVELR